MRTVVDIDDKMLRRAMRLTRLKKKVEVVNLALRDLVLQRERERILELAGEVAWSGDLAEMRGDRRGAR